MIANRNHEEYKSLGYIVIDIPSLSRDAYEELARDADSKNVEVLAEALLESDYYHEVQESFYDTFKEISKKRNN